ncbi:MAG: TetR/AcrR family transcriptional regulator [Anaerolineales bacterium]|nr:TetR/AcrR family transcriptional regulator [Anaerolineales bacterium]
MPYPAQVNREHIIRQAREMIEAEGTAKLSLAGLAAAFGIKAPSLYRHVGNKASLLRAVNLLTTEQLFAAMNGAAETAVSDPHARLLAIFHAFRRFAHDNPNSYQLMMVNREDALRPDEDLLVQMVLPIQTYMAEICGEANSLAALRGALALVHGFAMLELNQQLRRGGDLDAAFTQSVTAYLKGWQQS